MLAGSTTKILFNISTFSWVAKSVPFPSPIGILNLSFMISWKISSPSLSASSSYVPNSMIAPSYSPPTTTSLRNSSPFSSYRPNGTKSMVPFVMSESVRSFKISIFRVNEPVPLNRKAPRLDRIAASRCMVTMLSSTITACLYPSSWALVSSVRFSKSCGKITRARPFPRLILYSTGLP